MKTEIENLFDLSSCEHDSYSSSAVCHFARVLYKNAWISIDWQITFWGDRLPRCCLGQWHSTQGLRCRRLLSHSRVPLAWSLKKLTGACYAGYGYSSHTVSLSWQLETKLYLRQITQSSYSLNCQITTKKEAVKKWLEHKRLKYID